MTAVQRLGAIVLAAMLVSSGPALADRRPTTTDIGHYAVATCLTLQKSDGDYLRHQGEYANSVLLEHLGGVVFEWRAVGDAVQAELVAEGPYAVHVDAPVAESTKFAPVAQCLFITDSPRIRRAIAKAATRLRR